MNDWDKNNLNFIRSLNEQQFDEWASTLPEDDVDYAVELLQRARMELMYNQLDEVNETAVETANEYLRKFRL